MEYSTNDFDELYVEAEMRLDGKKSVPVRSRIYSHQSPQSSINADKWKRKLHLSIGKPVFSLQFSQFPFRPTIKSCAHRNDS